MDQDEVVSLDCQLITQQWLLRFQTNANPKLLALTWNFIIRFLEGGGGLVHLSNWFLSGTDKRGEDPFLQVFASDVPAGCSDGNQDDGWFRIPWSPE